MNTMMVNDLVKSDLALKSDGFYNDVETLLEDMANPINDLKTMLQYERMSEKEKMMIKDWMERLQALSDEIDDWNNLYD